MSVKMKDDSPMRTVGKYKPKRFKSSKPDSERDSGFSDASSEHLSTVDQTDSEDATRVMMSAVPGSRSQPSQLAVVGGSFQSLSPMIIMNNVLLKQPGDNPSSLKPWGFSPAVEVVQQPQVVFLQPMVSQRSATAQKGSPNKKRRHEKYRPILKSYPKIAPHPGDSPRNNCTSSNSSTASSVKSCSSSSSSQDRLYGDRQQGLQTSASSGSSTPNHPTPLRHLPTSPQSHKASTDSNTGSCSSVEGSSSGRPELTTLPTDELTKSLEAQPVVSKDDCQESDSEGSNKRKRFCNTYNILSKSGLLDITLRTKELIRLNRRTQAELDLLREHTDLFMEALETGDFSKLQLCLPAESDKEKPEDKGSETQADQLQ